MLPYIEQAKFCKYSCIILDPNSEQAAVGPMKLQKMYDHTEKSYNEIIKKSPAREYFWVAHSAGGHTIYNLLKKYCIFLMHI